MDWLIFLWSWSNLTPGWCFARSGFDWGGTRWVANYHSYRVAPNHDWHFPDSGAGTITTCCNMLIIWGFLQPWVQSIKIVWHLYCKGNLHPSSSNILLIFEFCNRRLRNMRSQGADGHRLYLRTDVVLVHSTQECCPMSKFDSKKMGRGWVNLSQQGQVYNGLNPCSPWILFWFFWFVSICWRSHQELADSRGALPGPALERQESVSAHFLQETN